MCNSTVDKAKLFLPSSTQVGGGQVDKRIAPRQGSSIRKIMEHKE